jgi:hypothetical protein
VLEPAAQIGRQIEAARRPQQQTHVTTTLTSSAEG